MEEDAEGEPAQRQKPLNSSNQTPAVRQSQKTSWSLRRLRRTLQPLRGWCSSALVGVVWSVCQAEVPLHRLQVDVCWRLLLVCLLWTVLAGCVHALKCCLRPGRNQKGEPPLRIQQEAVTENKRNQYSWTSPSRSHDILLALVLADSLLLCVLQEPLADPSVPHIKALLSRLESVSHTLDVGSEAKPEEPDRDSALTDKVKVIRNYLQQRVRSLRRLVQVQGDFEASVKDMQEGLDGLWAQLEELHTGVTLTKEGSHKDLVSAQSDAEVLFAVLGHYRSKLECSQAHLKDSTQLLQELTWSHAHISSSSESVWPELLLQSNIEQFDKVQEGFLALKQQTSTFQAHLQGLGKGNQNGHAGPRAHADGTQSRPVSPQPSLHLNNNRRRSEPSADADTDTDTETDARLTLCERSALQFSSTIGRLRKSGRRK